MTRRTGVTLLEVLVAIFVMGIGMLALLVLFPVGILTMRQAIQDDRVASSGTAATAIAKFTISPSSFDKWFNQADWDQAAPVLAAALSDKSSHPLFLDTIGQLNYLAPYITWVGGYNGATGSIRRLGFPSPTASTNANALNWQISPDDIRFETVDRTAYGLPTQITPGVFERNSTYSWAYLLRRPINGKPNVVNLSVVVFNDRPLALNPNSLQAGETVYNATFDPTQNLVAITWGGPTDLSATPPAINIGGWILDSTPVQRTDPVTGKANFGPSHARFYRVVGITQNATAANGQNSANLEVQSPIKGFPLPSPPNPANTYTGTIVVIEGIAEVLEKGPVEFQSP